MGALPRWWVFTPLTSRISPLLGFVVAQHWRLQARSWAHSRTPEAPTPVIWSTDQACRPHPSWALHTLSGEICARLVRGACLSSVRSVPALLEVRAQEAPPSVHLHRLAPRSPCSSVSPAGREGACPPSLPSAPTRGQRRDSGSWSWNRRVRGPRGRLHSGAACLDLWVCLMEQERSQKVWDHPAGASSLVGMCLWPRSEVHSSP